MGRVTLTETAVKTPKGYMVLTPEVHAHAEQHGNKQVVQGWVFKSDNDRREIYLHIDGPSQSIVVPYQLKNRAIEPAQVHALAAAINTAAHTA